MKVGYDVEMSNNDVVAYPFECKMRIMVLLCVLDVYLPIRHVVKELF